MERAFVDEKVINLTEQSVSFLNSFLTAVTEKLPSGRSAVKEKFQLHVQRVTTSDVELCSIIHALVFDHHQRAVHAAESGCAGDHGEGIGGSCLARVMDKQNGDAESVGQRFHLADHFVVTGVAVLERF